MKKHRRFSAATAIQLLALLILLGAAALAIHKAMRLTEPVPSTPSPTVSDGSAQTPAPSPTQPAPSEEPTASPTAAPEDEIDRQARAILADMSLHEKVCQLFIVYPEAITGVGAVTAAGETTRQALEDYPVGGFLYDKKNMRSKEQVADMLAGVQSCAKIPLILTCDEEGGRVNRLMSTVGTTWMDPMLDYKDQGPDKARSNAATIASDMKALGFNMDLAPVADVWSNPDNTVIGDRAYSDDFQQAAQLVAAAVEGFHQGGVAAVLKHFPGHGNTSADSHYGAVYVARTLEELRQNELVPFQAGIDAGVDAVMVGHLIVSDISDDPAPFSYEIVTGLLREEMGFDGVVMTDGLQMQAMTDQYSSAEIALQAVQAGVDLLLCPLNLEGAVDALTQAVEDGTITEARLDESVLRILTLKLNWGIIPAGGAA